MMANVIDTDLKLLKDYLGLSTGTKIAIISEIDIIFIDV